MKFSRDEDFFIHSPIFYDRLGSDKDFMQLILVIVCTSVE